MSHSRGRVTTLKFHAIWAKGILYRQFVDKVDWFYSTPKYLFKPIARTMLLAPITIWCIWTTRCTMVFSAHKRPPNESIKLTWHTLITTLRAQYERIAGTDDVAELMRLNFRKWWCTTPMAAANGMDI